MVTLLDPSTLLVVCEQRRVQILSLTGVPLQMVNLHAASGGAANRCGTSPPASASASDLWSICTMGRFTYVTDKGRNCVHVLLPPRTHAAPQTPE